MGEYGLMIVNGDRRLVTSKRVTENSYEPLLLANPNHARYHDLEVHTWVLRRSREFYEKQMGTYYIEQPSGEVRPRLIQNVPNPAPWCRAMASSCKFSAGYDDDCQACWKIRKISLQ